MILKALAKSIRANILVGFFLTIPVVTTVLVFNFLFKITTNWIPKNLMKQWSEWFGEYPVRAAILAAIIALLWLIGVLMRNFFGRYLYQLSDKMMTAVPFIRGIYIAVRQISESLFTQRKTLFKEVVLIQYPRKGLYSIAFVTAIVPESVTTGMHGRDSKEEAVSLFIPTTPNPTSGVLILAPRSETVPLTIPVAEALTFVMSAGAVAPGEQGDTRPTLLDKLETWLKREDTQHELQEHDDAGSAATS